MLLKTIQQIVARKNNKSVSLHNKQNFWLQNKSHLALYNVSVW